MIGGSWITSNQLGTSGIYGIPPCEVYTRSEGPVRSTPGGGHWPFGWVDHDLDTFQGSTLTVLDCLPL